MILCFSGTGNSLYAARLISAAAGDEVVSLNALLRGCLLYTSRCV